MMRIENEYHTDGMRRTVEAVILTHDHRHPHILLLQIGGSFFKLYALGRGALGRTCWASALGRTRWAGRAEQDALGRTRWAGRAEQDTPGALTLAGTMCVSPTPPAHSPLPHPTRPPARIPPQPNPLPQAWQPAQARRRRDRGHEVAAQLPAGPAAGLRREPSVGGRRAGRGLVAAQSRELSRTIPAHRPLSLSLPLRPVFAHGFVTRRGNGVTQYPYVPAHITKPREQKKLFLIQLPERCTCASEQGGGLGRA